MVAGFSTNRQQTLGLIGLSLLPILLFFYYFFQYISNIPFQDDYDALLEPVTKFVQMPSFSWAEFIKIIWTQDDERRIVLDRLVAIGSNACMGTLDLRLQAFLGLLSILGILYLLYEVIRGANLPLVFLPICSLLLFHIQYYETIYWAMIPLQHVVVYFFVLLAFYYLSAAGSYALAVSLLAAVLAILSDVSGTFILPAGLLLLLVQRRWWASGLWALVIGGLVLLYYYNFTVPAFRPKLSDNLQYPVSILGRLLTISGVAFDVNSVLPASFRIGLVMVMGAVLWSLLIGSGINLIRKALQKKVVITSVWESTLWGGLIHFSITLLALAVGRAVEGIEPLLISRYKHIGFIWLILIILLVASQVKLAHQRTLRRASLLLSVSIFLFSYFQYTAPLDYYYKERHTDMYEWSHNRAIPSSPIYLSVRPAVDFITLQAIRAGVYQLPEHYFFDGPYQPQLEEVPLKVEHVDGHTLSFTNDSFKRHTAKHDGAFIVLQSPTQQHILPSNQSRYSLKSFLLSLGKNYYATGFSSILTSKFLTGNQRFRVSVLVIDGDTKRLYPTRTQIQVSQGVVKVTSLDGPSGG